MRGPEASARGGELTQKEAVGTVTAEAMLSKATNEWRWGIHANNDVRQTKVVVDRIRNNSTIEPVHQKAGGMKTMLR